MRITKKVIGLLIGLLLLTGTTAFAGDIPESIMSGEHKAMFIGQITAINKDTITIKPLTIMMGSVEQPEIDVKKFQSYSQYSHPPRKNDYLVALLIDDSTIDETYLFECSSADYKTLEILCWKDSMLKRYQKYINNGDYFKAQENLAIKTAAPSSTLSPTAAPTQAQTPAALHPSSTPAALHMLTPVQPAAASATENGSLQASTTRQSEQSSKNTIILITGTVLMIASVVLVILNKLSKKRRQQ